MSIATNVSENYMWARDMFMSIATNVVKTYM